MDSLATLLGTPLLNCLLGQVSNQLITLQQLNTLTHIEMVKMLLRFKTTTRMGKKSYLMDFELLMVSGEKHKRRIKIRHQDRLKSSMCWQTRFCWSTGISLQNHPWFAENSPKKRKYPVSSCSLGEIPCSSQKQWQECFELIGRWR